MIINELKLTCQACPVQYEGLVSEGEWEPTVPVLIRYRHGKLSVDIAYDGLSPHCTIYQSDPKDHELTPKQVLEVATAYIHDM